MVYKNSVVNVNDHAVFYVARLSRASRLSSSSRLFYESTSSIVCLAIADDEELAVDDALADIGVVNGDVFYSTLSWVVVEFDRHIVGVECIYLYFHLAIYFLNGYSTIYHAPQVQWVQVAFCIYKANI